MEKLKFILVLLLIFMSCSTDNRIEESEVIEEFVAYKFGQLESLLKDYDQEVVTEVLSSFVISGNNTVLEPSSKIKSP